MEKLKVGIVGFRGYTGGSLLEILSRHPRVKIAYLADKEKGFDESNPYCRGRSCCENIRKSNLAHIPTDVSGEYGSGIHPTRMDEEFDPKASSQFADLFFLALPHTISMLYVNDLLKAGKKVIDLSADFRFPDVSVYEEWYKAKHKNPEVLNQAVYGLPEIFRAEIKKAKLIANPGCYPTAVILGTLPLLKKDLLKNEIIVDAKSGASGAGKRLDPSLLFSAVNENLKPYKVNSHQHAPEIKMILEKIAGNKIDLTFVPHLIPMNRGLLATIYLSLNKSMGTGETLNLYREFYSLEPFIKILPEGKFPQTKEVVGTNYCRIGISLTKNKAIIISALDNLIKGAAGQAVENMNIMSGWDEIAGLL